MPWSKIDDAMTFSPKVVAAGNTATGAWVRLIAWCNHNLTDGIVPRRVLWLVSDSSCHTIQKLLGSGLMDDLGDGTYRVHDFLAWNDNADTIRANRKRISDIRSEAAKKGAEARKARRSGAGAQQERRESGEKAEQERSPSGVLAERKRSISARLLAEPSDKIQGGSANGEHVSSVQIEPYPTQPNPTYIHSVVVDAPDGKTLTQEPPAPDGKLTVGAFHERLLNEGLGVVPPKWSPLVEKLAPFTDAEVTTALTQARASGGRVVPGFVIRIIERWRTEPPEQPKSGPMPGSEWAASRQRETQLRKAEREHRKPECDEAERGQRQEQGAKAIGDILAGLFDPTEAKP